MIPLCHCFYYKKCYIIFIKLLLIIIIGGIEYEAYKMCKWAFL